jgi:hypothetical protein
VRISAFATDYDGTLATEGEVAESTLEALRRLRASGRKLLMVTGRELADLNRVFPHLPLFDAVVAENGAVLWRPDTGEQLLASLPPRDFIDALRRRAVEPLVVGRSIVATSSANASVVQAVIEQLGLAWQTILNKDSVMCLPVGVDKASGVHQAAAALGLDLAAIVGVGDAENDLPFLGACGIGAAVANALPDVKAAADVVTPGAEGDGVVWLIDRILAGWTGAAAGHAAAAH